MFVNYFRNPVRPSPVNLAVARVFVGFLGIWKLVSYGWSGLQTWPRIVFETTDPARGLLPGWMPLSALSIEVVLAIVCLVFVVIGYRLAMSAFFGALLIAHLSGIHYTITNQASTFLPIVYFLLLFAVFRHEDQLSLDGIRRTANESIDRLNRFLRTTEERTYRQTALRYGLVLVALMYFFTGFWKVVDGPFRWGTGENLARIILWESEAHVGHLTPVGDLLLDYPGVLALAAWSTMILEVGLLVVVIAGLPIAPFVIGLLGMHFMIAVSMQIVFFDQLLLFALFLPWDDILARTARDEPLMIVYDGSCYFCVRSLYPFKLLDVTGSVTFVPQRDAPADIHRRGSVDLDSAMYAFGKNGTYGGYDAFRRLLTQYGLLLPLSLGMNVWPVKHIGERIYELVAANRHRIATCSLE